MCAYRAACGQCIEHNLYLSVVSELGYEVAFATLEAIYVLGFNLLEINNQDISSFLYCFNVCRLLCGTRVLGMIVLMAFLDDGVDRTHQCGNGK